MINEIHTGNGIISFEEKDFSKPKPIDTVKATKNLLAVKKILDSNNTKFGLMFGTLLGAVRENSFIKHDEDVDLFVLEEDKEKLFNCIHDFINIGFQVCRYDKKLLSIIRDDEYIDFYFFRKALFFFRTCFPGATFRKRYLEETVDYVFLDNVFQVPNNTKKFLKVLYGPEWRIPKKNVPADAHSPYFKLKEYIYKHLPYIVKLIRILKNK